MSPAEPILRADDVTVRFGGVRAVSGVSLDLARDELLGLVGPNGSGKTTFLNALSGAVAASGKLTVEGTTVPFGKPTASWGAGLARVFQAPQTFLALSCLENVLLSSSDRALRGGVGAFLARPAMNARERQRWTSAVEALEFVGLADFTSLPSGMLTYGQRRLLELARAINGRPKVLLLDEPSAGLNDAETAGLAELLKEVKGRGVALLLIDHKVDFLDSLCDRLVVLELGEVIATGTPDVVWADERVITAYLGAPADAAS
jgi:branched-chain amino acid transport system ATP-binding protein